jgi:hypothetical protein
MATLPDFNTDPTLDAVLAIMQAKIDAEEPRGYLGASSIGAECERQLWYQFNGYPARQRPVRLAMAAEDGHRTEALVIERLRLVPGIQLWTHDETTGEQYGFSKYDDRFKGHYDGVVLGLLQAPKTPHLFEVKTCNEKIFNAFLKSKDTCGDKGALEDWNPKYYAQAQVYMAEEKLDRHYTIVASAGGRDMVSCRTEFNAEKAAMLDKKALRIINARTEPVRITSRKEHYLCKWCAYSETCWGEGK